MLLNIPDNASKEKTTEGIEYEPEKKNNFTLSEKTAYCIGRK